MKTIYLKDLKKSFFSIKSIVIIILLFSFSAEFGRLSAIVNIKDQSRTESLYNVISLLVLFLSSLIFSGIISRYTDNGSIRYIALYQPRIKIVLAKYFAMLSYFILVILGATLILDIFSKKFGISLLNLIQTFSLIAYSCALILLLSIILNKEATTFFVGILMGLIFPILGNVGIGTRNIFLNGITWLLPYRYLLFTWGYIIIMIMTLIIMGVSAIIFKRKAI